VTEPLLHTVARDFCPAYAFHTVEVGRFSVRLGVDMAQLSSFTTRLAALRGRGAALASGRPRAFVGVMIALSAGFWFAMGATALFAHQVFDGVPDRGSLSRVTEMARASVFYDHENKPAFAIFREQRIEVPLSQMSGHLKHAMIAIEDQRFFEHQGIDMIRMAGAALVNLREQRAAQGASTITQQLARLSFLTPDKTFTRKLQEIVLAAVIETEYSKDLILELYLNKVYFGAGLYGAEAASLGYFGKHAADLTVAEAALLAGLVKAPSSYAPTVNLERALKRRAVVLQAMRDTGAIDQATFDAARSAKPVLVDALRKEEPYGRFFKEHVRRELVARFGEDRVYEGGLRVFTTIDVEMQRAADAEVQRVLKDLERRRNARAKKAAAAGPPLQASLVAIDPRNGEVRALIGGRDFIQSNYNRALQAKRQPGSAFKPFVYAAALEAGYTPASLIEHLDEPIQTVQGAWVPEEGHSTATAMTMRSALKTSSNRAAVRMIEDLGVKKAVAYAERVGMGVMPSVPSLALGSGEVTLESLTSAYAVFASAGVRRPPIYIRRVETADGEVLYTAPNDAEQVVGEQTAYLMTHMLADVINHGTAWRARQLGFKLPAAGKTGTTNDYHDAWFVGYTPRLVTGVWVGFDQPQPIIAGGYAADVAVPMWAAFMRKATDGDPAEWYKAPRGIVSANVCRLSGKRPVEGCYGALAEVEEDGEPVASSVYTEYFVKGTEPEDTCPLHSSRSIFSRVAGWLGGSTPAAPEQRRSDVRTADEVTTAEARVEEAARETAKEPEKKKRGFWSRVFGVGRDKDGDKRDDRRNDPRKPPDRER
jgi:1A family penicillin-binding protein